MEVLQGDEADSACPGSSHLSVLVGASIQP